MNAPQAALRAGITYRQFDHWWRKGWIGSGPIGQGHLREITAPEMRRIMRLAALVSAGMNPQLAAAALDRAIEDNGAAVIVTGSVRIIVEAA